MTTSIQQTSVSLWALLLVISFAGCEPSRAGEESKAPSKPVAAQQKAPQPTTAPAAHVSDAAQGASTSIPIEFNGTAMQGGMLVGKTTPGAEVVYRRKKIRVSDTGEFLVAFGPYHPEKAWVTVKLPDGREARHEFTVEQRTYDVQEIEGLPDEEINLDSETKKELREWRPKINAARDKDTAEPLFRSGFDWPSPGPITGVYGSRRLLNGKKAQPHWGVDIGVRAGRPVKAPADAIVAFAAPDEIPLAGRLLILDHGHGLTSSFLHLKTIKVKEGARVRKGQVIATVGATGRATGAHLDWRMNLFDVRVDPETIVPRRSKPKESEAGAGSPPLTER